jgi:hypothetical protein
MTLFAIHDESGRISQANKVFVGPDELKKYQALLSDLGHAYAKVRHPGLLPPEYWYVRKTGARRKEVAQRPVMPAAALAPIIKAGTDAVITGIPNGASIDVFAIGYLQKPLYSEAAFAGGEVEFLMPAPAKYRVVIRLWPYRDSTIEVEAVA